MSKPDYMHRITELYSEFDDLYFAGLFEEAGKYLDEYPPETEQLEVICAVLTITSRGWVKEQIPNRKEYVNRVIKRWESEGKSLTGLDGLL